MTKHEYLEELREYLQSYNVERSFINENLDYYSIYIDNETAKGRDADSVISELGSASTLGRSIVDRAVREGRVTRDPHSNKAKDDDPFAEEENSYSYEYSADKKKDSGSDGGITPGRLKLYLILGLIFAALVIIMVIGIIANLFRLFLPVLIIGIIVVGAVLFFGRGPTA
ncbi:MAG: hypothetical protein IJM62_05575 [Lachnospiraceae bacterium]|nr:hypothetical protein [Lachnospiraceae bacterium]